MKKIAIAVAKQTVPKSSDTMKMVAMRSCSGRGRVIPKVRIKASATRSKGFLMDSLPFLCIWIIFGQSPFLAESSPQLLKRREALEKVLVVLRAGGSPPGQRIPRHKIVTRKKREAG